MVIRKKIPQVIVLARQHKHLLVLRQVLQVKRTRLRSHQVQLQQKKLNHHLLISQRLTANQSQATPAPETKQNQEPSAKQTPSQVPSNQQGTQAKQNQPAYDPATDRKLQDKQAEHNKRYKGVLTMVDKDFSAAAGNWKGANGETITVSSSGQFTVESADGKKENYSIQSYSYTLDDGKYNAEVGGGKVIQITTGADGTVSSVTLIKP